MSPTAIEQNLDRARTLGVEYVKVQIDLHRAVAERVSLGGVDE